MDESLSMAPPTDARWSGAGTIALNSERIRARYGNCSVRVLEQRESLRRTGLFSNDARGDTCRTFAIVRFATEIPAALATAHARIVAGDSIGVSLADLGLPIERRTLAIESLGLDESASPLLDIMRITAPSRIALHIYRLELVEAGGPLPYATIAELHHPSYLDEAVLRQEFGPARQAPTDRAACDDMLDLVQRFEVPDLS